MIREGQAFTHYQPALITYVRHDSNDPILINPAGKKFLLVNVYGRCYGSAIPFRFLVLLVADGNALDDLVLL